MNRLIFIPIALFCGIHLNVFAQRYTFDDGVLPTYWLGQNTYFEIDTSNRLHLKAPAGTSMADLKWPALNTNNTVWEFYFNYDFSASTTNYACFYLLSAEENFISITNKAYYLKLGGIAGTTDKIELIYQNGPTKTTILSSKAGIVGKSSVAMRVRVSKTANGIWELFVDETGNSNFLKEATAQHSSSVVFSYTGLRCIYSSTRRDKTYLDDIFIYEPFSLTSYSITEGKKITLTFSKNIQLDNTSLIDFSIGQNYTTTVAANQIEIKVGEVILPDTYNLMLKNFKDMNGDTLWNTSIKIIKPPTYYAGQIRLTEWMSDPSPSYGLPEIEWVELLNTCAYTVDLSVFSLSDPSTKTLFPAYQLKPNTIVVVCANGGCKQLNIENCIEVASMPSLNNSGDTLFLRAKDEQLIDFIHYELTKLPKDYRQDGGYSIGREVLPDACFFTQKINFSSAQIGGTPGFLQPFPEAPERIQKTFSIENESLIVLQLPIIGNIQTNNFNPSGLIASIQPLFSEGNTRIEISLKKPMEEGSLIELYLDSMQTCLRESLYLGEKLNIVFPKPIQQGDVFLNEILYNAITGGVDFIELYNTTEKYIQLQNTHYLNVTPGKNFQHVFVGENCIIAPYGYKVISSDNSKIKKQYPNTVMENCFEKSGFLSFADEGGEVFFVSNKADTLDKIQYGDQFQNPLNRNDEGISLEKIKSQEWLFSPSNWTSSGAKATPGYKNSQAMSNESTSTEIFYCSPCHVTTNINGHSDYVHLHLNPEVKGAFASIRIYTISGEVVSNVCENQLLGTSNTFNWYGQKHTNGLLPDGIYIAVAEWWSPEGEMHTEKIAISTSQY